MPRRRTPHHDLRVVHHHPDRERRVLGFCALAVLLAVLAGYLGGRWQMAEQTETAVARLDALSDRHRAVVIERDALQRALSDERLAQEMGRSSESHVRATLAEQVERIRALEGELRFYRSLMAGDEAPGRLDIAEFELMRRLEGPGVRFRLLLVQPADPGTEVSGQVRVRVFGERDGQREVLSGPELGLEQQGIPFRFRYFQDLAGEIELPEGFEPEGVEVIARTAGSDGFELQRRFGWQLQEA
jgi:hypothetical protein